MTVPLWGGWTGVPVHLSHVLDDGKVIAGVDPIRGGGQILLIGTRPMTDVEFAGAEGRYIVRRGMADVLEWIGEEVGPAPRQSGKGQELWDKLRAATRTPQRVPDFPA